MFDEFESILGKGRKVDQKMKPFLVYQYLLRNTDEEHYENAESIANYLTSNFGISAERRSIYRDIQEINKAVLAFEEGIPLEEAAQILEEDEEAQIIRYKPKKGFYVAQRHYDLKDIRLLAECVYTAKFVTEKQSKQLLDVICQFVSEHQADKIVHDAFSTDRTKTANSNTLNNISTINDAMSAHWDGQPHTPEKITFKYLKYSISDISKQVERRQGARYKVSPYHFLINDGNYYLLAFDDQKKEMRTYRVDRMRDVRFTEQPREGEEVFEKIDLKSYTQQHFSMFGGAARHITLRAINPLLDAMVERFGNDRNNALYAKVDDSHFSVTVKVEISDQFFGWLLGFGKKVKLIAPDDVIEQFTAYVDKIREMY